MNIRLLFCLLFASGCGGGSAADSEFSPVGDADRPPFSGDSDATIYSPKIVEVQTSSVAQVPRGCEAPAGMVVREKNLYVVGFGGQFYSIDISDPRKPVMIHEATGLGKPWEVILVGARGYVADNSLGVVVVDIGAPDINKPNQLGWQGTCSWAVHVDAV